MSYFVYAFEAKDIQPYILEQTRLAEMVGASGIIDAVCVELLDAVALVLGLELASGSGACRVARRGGGGFTLVLPGQDQAERLRNLISLLVPQFAPGLGFVHAIGVGDALAGAIEDALSQLESLEQSRLVPLPLAAPMTLRAPRTGLPAWGVFPRYQGDAVDRAALAKRRFRDDRLGWKFLPDEAYVWPRNMDPNDPGASPDNTFPFASANHRVGIVHVDGNGFGQALKTVRELVAGRDDFIVVEHEFSILIERLGRIAAQRATESILRPHAAEVMQEQRKVRVMPARPLVMGGDDLTLILRADLALDFVEAYVNAFEAVSHELMEGFARDHGLAGLPPGLSACAGIAFVGAKRPFYRAYLLAETLCDRAKAMAKQAKKPGLPATEPIPSFIAFAESTARMPHQEDLCVLTGSGYRVSGNCYHTGTLPVAASPGLEGLRKLKDFFVATAALASRPLHEILETLRRDEPQGLVRWRRWREVIARKEGASGLQQFDSALAGVAEQYVLDASTSPVLVQPDQNGGVFPLGDVLVWLKAEAQFDEDR